MKVDLIIIEEVPRHAMAERMGVLEVNGSRTWRRDLAVSGPVGILLGLRGRRQRVDLRQCGDRAVESPDWQSRSVGQKKCATIAPPCCCEDGADTAIGDGSAGTRVSR